MSIKVEVKSETRAKEILHLTHTFFQLKKG